MIDIYGVSPYSIYKTHYFTLKRTILIMEFNEIIKKLRLEKGLTQQEVAYELKIDQSTYAHYESGRRTPDIDKLRLLATYYCLVDELLGVNCVNKEKTSPLYGKYYKFNNLFPDSPVDMSRVYPLKQSVVNELNIYLSREKRVKSAMLFGSSITIQCNKESDIDLVVRLNDDSINREVKSEISEKVLEICDWNADLLWFDTIDKNEKIYHDICKGVQIA